MKICPLCNKELHIKENFNKDINEDKEMWRQWYNI